MNDIFTEYHPIQLKGDDIHIDFGPTYQPEILDWKPTELEQYQPLQQQINSYGDNETLPELLKNEGFSFKVTSGYRKDSKTKSGHISNHSKGTQNNSGAYDIVPIDGNFNKFKSELYSNPNVVRWLQTHNWGILEEDTADVMKKTGATGKHFHFGPDTWAKEMSMKNGIQYAQEGGTLGTTYKSPDIDEEDINMPDISYQPIDISQIFNKSNIDNIMNQVKQSSYFQPTPKQENSNKQEVDLNLYYGYPEFEKNLEKAAQKDPLVEKYSDLLTKTAERESKFKINSKNPNSSASGLFGFTDATKNAYSKYYNNGYEGQIIAAAHLADDIFKNENAQKLLNKGYNPMQVLTLGWWRPKSLSEVLKNPNSNISIGGLSTQGILSKYA